MHDRPHILHVHVNEVERECDMLTGIDWLPVLGPSACSAFRVVLSFWPKRDTWFVDELAVRCGLSVTNFWRTIDRMVSFKTVAMFSTDVIVVPTHLHLPRPTARMLEHIRPEVLS
jgi:hypothetical protein